MKDYFKEAGNIHLSYYLEAADKLGIKYEMITGKTIARFEYKNKHWFIINAVTPLISAPSKTIAVRKHLTNTILSKHNIPVPKQAPLLSVEDAVAFYKENETIVLKPKQGIGGKGISVLPSSIEEVESAFKFASRSDASDSQPKVLGEEYIEGENYRFLTLNEEVIGIVKRLKPSVEGNGKDTIQDLILTTNPKIPIDYETTKVLKSQGLSLKSIPKKREIIIARNNTNLTTGGKTEECSKQAHPYYKEIAIKAIKAIDVKLGGVDIIAEDITKPGKCAINEINYNPGLRIHYQVNKGEKIRVAIPIMKYIRDNQI